MKLFKQIPEDLLQGVLAVSLQTGSTVYLSGGAVRDWLLGRVALDFDFTVSGRGLEFGKQLADLLQGRCICLSEEEDVCRVIWKGVIADISTFRNNTKCIEDDLRQRDFTINAMAVELSSNSVVESEHPAIIDPLGGLKDLTRGAIKACSSGCLLDDPLRLLRAFRFMAQFNFAIASETLQHIGVLKATIHESAGERVWSELKKIFEQQQSWQIITAMESCGLLFEILPELAEGVGVLQPSSHHLDVFHHCLETLRQLEHILEAPEVWFASHTNHIHAYCADQEVLFLKLAALLHDIGKPSVCGKKDTGQITFYNHDARSVQMIGRIAQRLKWSSCESSRVSLLVKQHMRPFHLNNSRKKTGITPRACLRLAKDCGQDLVGLFILAMADSLAGQGMGKPAGMEGEMASLFSEVYTTFVSTVKPVLEKLPINGHDLIQTFQLEPGPLFGEIFSELEKEIVSRGSMDRTQALDWTKSYLQG